MKNNKRQMPRHKPLPAMSRAPLDSLTLREMATMEIMTAILSNSAFGLEKLNNPGIVLSITMRHVDHLMDTLEETRRNLANSGL